MEPPMKKEEAFVMGSLVGGIALVLIGIPAYLTYKSCQGIGKGIKLGLYGPIMRKITRHQNPVAEGCVRCIDGRDNKGLLEVLTADEKDYLVEFIPFQSGPYGLFNGLNMNVAGEVVNKGRLYDRDLSYKVLDGSFARGFVLSDKQYEWDYAWRNFYDYKPFKNLLPSEKEELSRKIDENHGKSIRARFDLSEDTKLDVRI